MIVPNHLSISSFQISTDDILPQQLCKACAVQLQDCHNFRTKTIRNEQYLRQLIERTSKEVNDEIIKEDKEDSIDEVLYQNEEYLIGDEIVSNIKTEDSFGSLEVLDQAKESQSPQKKRTFKNTEAKYECPECKKPFVNLKAQKIHMRFHTGQKLKYCCKCYKGFLKQAHLDCHMKKHGEINKCPYCEECFDMIKTFRTHMNNEHPQEMKKERSYKRRQARSVKHGLELKKPLDDKCVLCKICDKTLANIDKLRVHLTYHTAPGTLKDIDFSSKPYLFDFDEIRNVNDVVLIDYLIEKLKHGSFQNFYQILSREGQELDLSDSDSDTEYATRKYSCSKCHATFNKSKEILEHVEIHHDLVIFPNKCDFCKKQFPCKLLLERHLRKQCENKDKRFLCSLCPQRFFWSDSLKIHCKLYHMDEKRKFCCAICNRFFHRAEHLQRHLTIHSPEAKKYECPKCKKLFKRKDNLSVHMKIHEPNREIKSQFLCTFCGKSFSNSSNLIVHTRRHTGDKPYKCDLCEKAFPRSSDLQTHRRTHTGKKNYSNLSACFLQQIIQARNRLFVRPAVKRFPDRTSCCGTREFIKIYVPISVRFAIEVSRKVMI